MNWTVIRLDVDLSPVLCQAIILTNEVFSAITYQETDFNAKQIEINKFSLNKLMLNLSSYFAAIFPGVYELIYEWCVKEFAGITVS